MMLIALLKLIRLPNLLIVGLTQYLFYYHLLLPALQQYNITPLLDHLHFSLYVLVTIIITAGGYIINDIVDYDADMINKPERVIINKKISIQSAYWLYSTISLTGFLITVYLGFEANRVHLIGLYPAAFALLYYYSMVWKKKALIGNVLISVFCAGVAGAIWLAEYESLQYMMQEAPVTAKRIRAIFAWYMVFAFLATLFREIVKDLEDVKGDRSVNYDTLPIHWGEGSARMLAVITGVLLLIFLLYEGIYLQRQFGNPIIIFLLLAIVLPLAVSFQRLAVARSKKDYRFISLLAKIIMLNGLILLLFANY